MMIDSRVISKKFNSRHSLVIRNIKDTIDAIKEVDNVNAFKEGKAILKLDNRGKPYYLIDRDIFNCSVPPLPTIEATRFRRLLIESYNLLSEGILPER